jgi:hypothetical protein
VSKKTLAQVDLWVPGKEQGADVKIALPEYEHNGRTYVKSERGQHFGINVEPLERRYFEVLVSVDGVNPSTLSEATLEERGRFLWSESGVWEHFGGAYPFPFAFDALLPPSRGVHPAGFKLSHGLVAIAIFRVETTHSLQTLKRMTFHELCRTMGRTSSSPDELHEFRYEDLGGLLALGVPIGKPSRTTVLNAREKAKPFPATPTGDRRVA